MPCSVFLDFSILFQIFCSGLQLLGDAVLAIQKLIVMSEKGGCRRHEIKTDIFNIPYSIFHIPYTNPEISIGLFYIRLNFVCLGKFVDISYVNHFGALIVYKLRTLQIPKPFHFHFTLSCWLVLLCMVEGVEQELN